MKDKLEKVKAKDLKTNDLILTVDEEGGESLEQVNCIDNGVVWMADINDEDHPENIEDIDSYYTLYRIKTQD